LNFSKGNFKHSSQLATWEIRRILVHPGFIHHRWREKFAKKLSTYFLLVFENKAKFIRTLFLFCLGDGSGAYAGWLAERLFSFIVNATIVLSILSFFLCTFLGLGRANK